MLSSIHPLGERAKGQRFAATAGAFIVGSVLGGLTTGATAALIGVAASALVGTAVATGVVAVAAIAAAVVEGSGRALPCLRRQVDENWLHEFRGGVYGLGFGFQLGAGVLTYITAAAIPLFLLAAVLAGDPMAAVALGGVFGLVRGASLLAAVPITTPDRLVAVHRLLHRTAPVVHRLSVVVLGVAGVGAGVSLL